MGCIDNHQAAFEHDDIQLLLDLDTWQNLLYKNMVNTEWLD